MNRLLANDTPLSDKVENGSSRPVASLASSSTHAAEISGNPLSSLQATTPTPLTFSAFLSAAGTTPPPPPPPPPLPPLLSECASCLSATSSRLVPCGHAMCLDCARRWVAISPTCPTCRTPVVGCGEVGGGEGAEGKGEGAEGKGGGAEREEDKKGGEKEERGEAIVSFSHGGEWRDIGSRGGNWKSSSSNVRACASCRGPTMLQVSSCGHAMCSRCAGSWFETHSSCPWCDMEGEGSNERIIDMRQGYDGNRTIELQLGSDGNHVIDLQRGYEHLQIEAQTPPPPPQERERSATTQLLAVICYCYVCALIGFLGYYAMRMTEYTWIVGWWNGQ